MFLNKKLVVLLVVMFVSSISFANSSEANKKYDVVAIGKAMVDIISYVSDEELAYIMPKDFKRSDTNKVNDIVANQIFEKMKDVIVIPGGSEANVVVNVASLGGKTAFNAIIADDNLGSLFRESLAAENVDYLSAIDKVTTKQTARCFTFITVDKDRTFAVSAAISDDINDGFIDYDAIKNSKVFYTDASNLDHDGVKSKVTTKAIDLAKSSSTSTVLNLNNNYYVETYRDEIISLLPKIDIIVGSEKEAKNLFKIDDLDEVITEYLKYSKIVIITEGRRGATIATKDIRLHVPTMVKQEDIVDLNGAGDGFIAGFLYGYTHDYSLKKSGELAAQTSAEIIYQVGARPKYSLRQVLFGDRD